jgi:hypothetical protein
MDQDLVGATAVTLEDIWQQVWVIHTAAATDIQDGVVATVTQD